MNVLIFGSSPNRHLGSAFYPFFNLSYIPTTEWICGVGRLPHGLTTKQPSSRLNTSSLSYWSQSILQKDYIPRHARLQGGRGSSSLCHYCRALLSVPHIYSLSFPALVLCSQSERYHRWNR
jgi:hypothetical protein